MFLFYEKKKPLNMYFKSAVLCSEFQVQFFLPRRLMCIKLSEILIPFFFQRLHMGDIQGCVPPCYKGGAASSVVFAQYWQIGL